MKFLNKMLRFMMETLFVLLFIFFSISISVADENVNLEHLTSECIESAKAFTSIQNDFAYKLLHTVQYEGWSGNSNSFKLIHPVHMTIKYAGSEKKGYYYFIRNPHKVNIISAKSDMEGSFLLREYTGDGFGDYTFHGTMKNGIIKGLWQKGNGRQAFAFYVKAIEKEKQNE